MRPGNLNGFSFAEANSPAQRISKLLVRHRPITYSKELCEQVYKIRLFTPKQAQKILSGLSAAKKEKTLTPIGDLPSSKICLKKMGLGEEWLHFSRQYINPLVENLWKTFTISQIGKFKVETYINNYSANKIRLRNDPPILRLIVCLFPPKEGGGILYPRWKTLVKLEPGEAILQPGGVSHEYYKIPVISGTECRIISDFY